MLLDQYQLEQTARRYAERTAQRQRNQRLIREGRYLEVDTPERVQKFLKRRGLNIDITGKPEIERVSPVMTGEVAGLPADLALERYLGTNDLMGVAFLTEGLRVCQTVARVWVGVVGGRPAAYGTGFMVSPSLLMTNHHVLEDAATARSSLAEFGYQRQADGTLAQSFSFALDPDVFFINDRDLDYAVVAVRGTSTGGHQLSDFGYNLLSEEEGKAIASQWANIIQHPSGEPKQVSLRENQIVDVLPNYLQYKSDTAPGSSGSPVFNDRWEIVALHHSGVYEKTADGRPVAIDGTPWRPEMGEDRIKWISNEGVRISRIIANLRGKVTNNAQRAMFEAMLVRGSETKPLVAGPASDPMPSVDGRPSLVLKPDGSATWTIPLTVSVNIGGMPAAQAGVAVPAVTAPVAVAGPPSTTVTPPVTKPAQTVGDGQSPNEVLAAATAALKDRANVLGVRLGYVFKDGRITTERALVVTVRRKYTPAELAASKIEELPTSFGGLKVQVTDPTIPELIQLEKGFAASEALALDADALSAEITYTPPPNPGLKRVQAKMKVVAHVSPDAGWTQLHAFLGKTSKSLVVGMYDFGARHILEAIEKASHKQTFKNMTLTIQPGQSVGEGTKADDLTDKEVTDELASDLGNKFKLAWVKIGVVNGWVASSYHIKVAVQDEKAFWLSSGNWQSSNQPAADPLKKPWDRSWLTKYNREWHAIVEHAGLAADFQKYLLYDFQNNLDGTDEAFVLPDILVPEEAFIPTALERQANFEYFEPFVANREFDVQPLLTPDNFHAHVLDLINSAEEELLIQNQTFNAPKQTHKQLNELVAAVLAKQKAGVKVRIIFRIIMKADARKNLEALQDYGFDMHDIKVQKNCHTKGVVVDRKRVMLGSQNWSEQGVSLNRDASLLFEDVELAEYFAKIFEHDWENLASDSIDIMPSGVELAPTAEATKPGFVKMSVEEYLETL